MQLFSKFPLYTTISLLFTAQLINTNEEHVR